MTREKVAIVKVTEQRLDGAVEQLINLLGNLEDIIPGGSQVMVKPNLVFPPTDRGITHPELIEAVVRLVAQTSPKEILIAEGSADVYTSQGFRFQGVGLIASRYGARMVDLNLESGVKTPVPEGLGREYVMVPEAVAQSDVFISLPVFKLWSNPMSLSLKNLIGLYGARYYGHNKDSISRTDDIEYALPGEVGTEQSAHKPRTEMSICAINSAVKTHLAIIDALEGGDGRGNFMRLNTLIGGCNPVAVDTVALRMSDFTASEYETFRLCTDYGLGPCTLDAIEVTGEAIDKVAFDLTRLREGVLEMPVAFCLDLLSTGELRQIQRALRIYELITTTEPLLKTRDALLAKLTRIISTEGYYERALAKCTYTARALLKVIAKHGGTSSSMVAVQKVFCEQEKGLYFYPAHRTLTRLGLAYAVDSTTRTYYLLPEGIGRVG
jgi:uncharacterized protein (DUF362 family)